MQVAVAWYQCPGDRIGIATQSHAVSDDGTAQIARGCVGMDAEQPGLCHAHAQVGNQSFDKSGFPHIPAFTAAGPVSVLRDVVYASVPATPRQDAGFLTRNTAPAIAVRNCCFRI